MKRLSSAQFRRTYASEQAPVEVTAYGNIIGTWIPAGSDTVSTPPANPEPEPEAARFTIRPAKHGRPVLTAKTVSVMDPLTVRAHEMSRSEEIQPRVFRTKRVD